MWTKLRVFEKCKGMGFVDSEILIFRLFLGVGVMAFMKGLWDSHGTWPGQLEDSPTSNVGCFIPIIPYPYSRNASSSKSPIAFGSRTFFPASSSFLVGYFHRHMKPHQLFSPTFQLVTNFYIVFLLNFFFLTLTTLTFPGASFPWEGLVLIIYWPCIPSDSYMLVQSLFTNSHIME